MKLIANATSWEPHRVVEVGKRVPQRGIGRDVEGGDEERDRDGKGRIDERDGAVELGVVAEVALGYLDRQSARFACRRPRVGDASSSGQGASGRVG